MLGRWLPKALTGEREAELDKVRLGVWPSMAIGDVGLAAGGDMTGDAVASVKRRGVGMTVRIGRIGMRPHAKTRGKCREEDGAHKSTMKIGQRVMPFPGRLRWESESLNWKK